MILCFCRILIFHRGDFGPAYFGQCFNHWDHHLWISFEAELVKNIIIININTTMVPWTLSIIMEGPYPLRCCKNVWSRNLILICILSFWYKSGDSVVSNIRMGYILGTGYLILICIVSLSPCVSLDWWKFYRDKYIACKNFELATVGKHVLLEALSLCAGVTALVTVQGLL